MALSTTILCGLTALGAISVAALQTTSSPQATGGLPDIEPGKSVMVDWNGDGPATGEVNEVQGSWVKVRFTFSEEATVPGVPEGKSVTMARFDAWVNFDQLTSYRVLRNK